MGPVAPLSGRSEAGRTGGVLIARRPHLATSSIATASTASFLAQSGDKTPTMAFPEVGPALAGHDWAATIIKCQKAPILFVTVYLSPGAEMTEANAGNSIAIRSLI